MTGRARSSRSSSREPITPDGERPTHLVVGHLGRAVGLRGELDVYVSSDHPDRFSPGSVLHTADGSRALVVRAARTHRQRTIVAFEGVEDRAAAERLHGLELVVPIEEARPLGEGEFWDHDLIGCEVVTTNGEAVGRVDEVMHPPANDVLVVRSEATEHLIPLIRTVVTAVDTATRRIVIDPIPGLLDPE